MINIDRDIYIYIYNILLLFIYYSTIVGLSAYVLLKHKSLIKAQKNSFLSIFK